MLTLLIWRPIIEWFVYGKACCKNRHSKDIMCYDKIGQCAQNVNTNTGSIVNIVSLRERKRIFTLTSFNLRNSRNSNPEPCNEMTVFVIRVQWPKISAELNVSTTGPHTLVN